MFDANGRLSLGILKRNLHQLGNVEQCVLSSASETTNVVGKSCLMKIYLQPARNNTFVNEIWEKAYNMNLFTIRPYEVGIYFMNAPTMQRKISKHLIT